MIQQLDQTITLALNGSDSLFWDNFMICVTNTFAWSLVIVMLLIIIFRNNYVRDGLIILLTIGLMIFVADCALAFCCFFSSGDCDEHPKTNKPARMSKNNFFIFNGF